MKYQKVRVFYHPQRGVFLSPGPIEPMCARYRGGSDTDWRELTPVEVELRGGRSYRPAPGQRLPRGFLWGDPSRQMYGMGGPVNIFGPLERSCRTCHEAFVFTAQEQRHWHEELGFYIDATAVHCRPCRTARQRLESARRAYELALRAAKAVSCAENHLAVARAAVKLIGAGGSAPIDKALGHCTRARRLGAAASADRVSESLRRIRDAASPRPVKKV